MALKKLRNDAFQGHGGLNKGQRLLGEPTLEEVLNETRDSANLLKFSSDPSVGGGASEALPVTGLKATDEILSVDQRVAGALNAARTAWNTQIDDGLTVEWTGDPGAGAIVDVVVRRVSE